MRTTGSVRPRRGGRWSPPIALLGAMLISARADAYTIDTFITDGCHELLTLGALRGVRAQAPTLAPALPVDATDRPMVDDLPFTVPADVADLAGVALVLGVRDNDLKGHGSTDLDGLALVHGDPSTQDEHCLRDLDDLEPDGTARAVARCRGFILGRVGEALDHLDATGAPDGTQRVALPVTLTIRGAVTVLLPAFYVRLGQALHALQDSFSHSYRTADGRRITTSLTWLHPVDDDLDEAVTGAAHSSALDRCTSLDPLRATRYAVADEASRAFLTAALSPGARDERLAAVDAVLDTYMSVQAGCTAANAWCDAPEHAYPTGAGGCSVAGTRRAWLPALLLSLSLLGFTTRRRRGRARAVALLATLLLAFPARAAAETRVTSAAPEARFAQRPAFGVAVSLGGALDRTAMSGSIGARLRLTPRWLVGLDAEWNPWASFEAERVRAGAFNAYATVVRRWSMLSDHFDVRTSLHLGTSTVLFDLYGVPAGTTGLYLGVSLLGLEWKATRMLSVIIDPADIAYPVPQLRGAPFGYLQYRFTLGLQWGA
jgi:hypothetical protein